METAGEGKAKSGLRTWPDDPRHYYHLYFEPDNGDGKYRAFVTIQTIRGSSGKSRFMRNDDDDWSERDRAISRLAQRLDLPDAYSTRSAARAAGYEAAHRFAVGQLSPDRVQLKRKVKDYQLIGGAAFRPDVMGWEATLVIKRKREASKGGTLTQTFEEISSPFRFNYFPTADRAASFGLEYGERMIIGMVAGLKI